MEKPDESPAPVKTPRLPRLKAHIPLRSRRLWLWTAAVVVTLGAASYGSLLLRNHISNLNTQNAQLQKKISSYQKLYRNASANSVAQTFTTLDDGVTDNGSGGTAIQVNADPGSPKKYISGEYAPFWLLNPYAVTIPDGVKMQRSTYTATDGQLFPHDDEGSAGCSIQGIIMTVTSDVFITGSPLIADGSSATYQRTLGCGDGDYAYVASAKYIAVPGITDHKYKYMEVVFTECKTRTDNWDADTAACGKIGGADSTKWTLYAGLVENDATEFTKGQVVDPGSAQRDLSDRPAKEVVFQVQCPANVGSYIVACNAKTYNSASYSALLDSSAYKSLQGIITGLHQTK
ncbi:MAG TPA: hypothetical protein VLF40_06365 [Candidatus Saccharimonadales bacterium]|nr:hypothetical protein [Candidatus Saccharimonadales bacterium]